MKEFNKNQKIVIICICVILIIAILYYVYGREEISNENTILPYEEMEENTGEKVINEEEKEEISEIIIYITGEVNKEGVYELKEGSRITDAIDVAGGLTEEADTKEINLAYVIEDGMKIKIPNKAEHNENEEYITKESGIETEISEEAKGKSKSTLAQSKININTATQEQLETLTGIGPSTANKIIEYRKKNGNFKKIEDIQNVSGIGESKYNKIKEQLIVKP